MNVFRFVVDFLDLTRWFLDKFQLNEQKWIVLITHISALNVLSIAYFGHFVYILIIFSNFGFILKIFPIESRML